MGFCHIPATEGRSHGLRNRLHFSGSLPILSARPHAGDLGNAHDFLATLPQSLQGDRRRAGACAADCTRDLVRRRARRRRHVVGFARFALLFGPAVDHDRAGLDLAVQSHLHPAGRRHEFGCLRACARRPVRPGWRLHGRPCGRLPRRWPARHAVRRRPVRRPRRPVLDPRPDHPDRARCAGGAAGHVVVAAPSRPAGGLCQCKC
ncbi:hypothetical protein ABIA44_007059 [Bradyrhizobium sp. USDA 329]